MGYLKDLAHALGDSLEEVSWSVSGTSVLHLNWASVETEELLTPKIIITPSGIESTRASRQNEQVDYALSVYVARHVETESQVDEMLDLVEEVLLQIRAHDFVTTWPSGINGGPFEIEVTINPDDSLNERNVWSAGISLTYRVFESNSLS
tara:strand:- start:13082 stop:13531 length:450 start_codon:yes stop_codon:yes gene_type:complete